MQQTPWGDVQVLRDRQVALRGSHRSEAKRSQAELLFAAMVLCCDRRGFKATSVENLLEISGLSRGTFYSNFDEKLNCFCAAEAEIVRIALDLIRQRLLEGGDSMEARARAALEAFIDLVVSQPAAARMCLVECYAAGDRGVTPIHAAINTIVELGRQALEELEFGSDATGELARGIVGGFYQVIYRRIQSRREAELPELVPALWDWTMSYRPLPGPLHGNSRRPNRRGVGALPPFAAFSPEERIIRAFAAVVSEKGYPATTVADVCATASISQTTFYQHFTDKADLMRAALNSSGAQLVAATMPAAQRAPDWPTAVIKAIERTLGFLDSEPDFARLRLIEVYSAGPEAIAVRDEIGPRVLRELLVPALAEAPHLPAVALEATAGATTGVCYARLRSDGAAQLQEATPLLAYLILAPMLGAERAYEIATLAA
jgi:AcrR family transcriptional regulator